MNAESAVQNWRSYQAREKRAERLTFWVWRLPGGGLPLQKGPKAQRLNKFKILNVGNAEGQDWNFQARLKLSSEIEIINRDWIFSIFGPFGVVVEKFVPSLERKFVLGFRRREPGGMSWEFCWGMPGNHAPFSRGQNDYINRRRAEYGFGEYGFKHRAQWVFLGLTEFRGRELRVFLSAYYLCAKANSASFSQNSPSLPENLVRLSEFSSPKQYSPNSIPPVSYSSTF